MRILVVHNDYGVYSGEEAVVDRMIGDLRACGHQVDTLRRSSMQRRDTLWGKIAGFFSGIYSFSGRRAMRRKLQQFRPDVVNIHNLYPFISPSVLPVCKRYGVPVVMTVHNYRLICPTGLFLRDGKPCENCLKNGNERDCIRYNCEHSRLRSLGYALRNMAARKSRAYLDNVDCYCCLTEFQRSKLIEAGFSREKTAVIPNYSDYQEAAADADGEEYVGYIGRLSEEKGFDLLLEVARRHPEIPFRFAGTARDGLEIETPRNATLCGQLDKKQLAAFIAASRFIVIPSRCYEGFPVAFLEAASHKRCCIAPNHGAFPDLMRDSRNGEPTGMLFEPANIDSLEKAVSELWNNKEQAEALGQKAEQNYKNRFLKQDIIEALDQLLRQITANNIKQ